jgi:hypothetical protein
MTNAYTDSPYAHERVGWDLRCEPDPRIGQEIREGDIPKCRHCCIERIAQALEESR